MVTGCVRQIGGRSLARNSPKAAAVTLSFVPYNSIRATTLGCRSRLDGEYDAFLSYSRTDLAWVVALEKNLLRHDVRVFRDEKSLDVGYDWMQQLERAASESLHMILVVSPASMASGWVNKEWRSFLQKRRGWADGKLIPVVLCKAPVPDFLGGIHELDLSTEPKYRAGVARLVQKLRGRTDDEEQIRANIEIPDRWPDRLESQQRSAIVELTREHACTRPVERQALARFLGQPDDALDVYTSAELAASAALFFATEKKKATQGALDLLDLLERKGFIERDKPEHDRLAALREELSEATTSLVESYLAYVARKHGSLLEVFGREDATGLLEKVYVELDLHSRPDRRNHAPQPPNTSPIFDGKLTLDALLKLTPSNHPWLTRRWVVRGDPGSGKTTLLRHLASKLAKDRSHNWVPIYESIPSLLGSGMNIEDLVERMHPGLSGLATELDRMAGRGRVLLLLDGLDEVPRADRERAHDLLRLLSSRWRKATLVVASRKIGYRSIDTQEFVELDLLPLDHARKRTFLTKWFRQSKDPAGAKERVNRVIGTIESDATLREISGCPLYLTIFAILIENGRHPSKIRHELYDQVFEVLMEGSYRRDSDPLPAMADAKTALAHLAHEMTQRDLLSAPVAELEALLTRSCPESVLDALARSGPWQRDRRRFLEDQALRANIIGPHNGNDQPWCWWHKSFREALTAEVLFHQYGEHGEDALIERARDLTGDEGRWAEPFALLTSRLPDPDRWIEALVGANYSLGLRALVAAQNVKPETIDRILATRPNDWESRAQVFQSIPATIDDPEGAIDVLVGLAKQTREWKRHLLHRRSAGVDRQSGTEVRDRRAASRQSCLPDPRRPTELRLGFGPKSTRRRASLRTDHRWRVLDGQPRFRVRSRLGRDATSRRDRGGLSDLGHANHGRTVSRIRSLTLPLLGKGRLRKGLSRGEHYLVRSCRVLQMARWQIAN